MATPSAAAIEAAADNRVRAPPDPPIRSARRTGMISPGGLYLRFHQWCEHGLATAYYRDVVRPRILRTPPVTGTIDPVCEVHVMTCRADWLNLVWTLKSFYRFSGRHYALCIHEDGTVPPEGIEQLSQHFPDARLIRRRDADARSESDLSAYPRSLAFRRTNVLSPKVFDFASYLQSERMLLLDSDVLFFAAPAHLLERIEDHSYRLNTVNRDVASAYSIEPAVVSKHAGIEIVDRFNSGLGLIHKASMRRDWIEEFLGLPGILDGHFWRIEQTLFALSSSRFGCELLPREYDVTLTGARDGRPSRHYVGQIRHLMYGEGIRDLSRAGALNARAGAFTRP